MGLKQLAKAVLPDGLWAALRRVRLRFTYASFRRRTVQHTYGGHPLRVCIADPLGAGWYDRDWPVMHEIELLRTRRLRVGARIFDLGAHQCVVALVMSRIVGPRGQVVAVEASSHDAAIGRLNAGLNDATNLAVLHAAMARRAGEISFDAGGATSSPGGNIGAGERVEALAVDDLTRRYGAPDLVFVDVEGYELEVLHGAGSTMAANPDWFVEVHTPYLARYSGSVDEVLAFFPEHRFERWIASDSHPAFRPFAEAGELLSDRFFLVALARS